MKKVEPRWKWCEPGQKHKEEREEIKKAMIGLARALGVVPNVTQHPKLRGGPWQRQRRLGGLLGRDRRENGWAGSSRWEGKCQQGSLTFVCNLASCFSSRLVCL